MNERELPMLAAIAGFFHWWEEFLTICSGPVLTGGILVGLISLMTDGKLLTTQPGLLYGWAVAMAVGLDGQLIGSSVKLSRAAQTGHPWRAAGYAVLVLALAYVAFVAAQVFATQQAEGITTSAALAQLGMDSTTWIIQRSVLAVALVVISGVLRYAAPKSATIADEQAKLERELTLEPLRAQVRMRKALGWRDVAAAGLGKKLSYYDHDSPPTGPGTPAAASRPATDIAPDTLAAAVEPSAQAALHLMPRRTTAAERQNVRKRARAAGLRASAFDALDHDPTMSRKALRGILNCAQTTANELYSAWQESRQREEVAQ
jgi:hypothetical protein